VIRYERRGPAALVTIDRPERHNAIDGPTAALLDEVFDRFAGEDDAAVLVLTGAGDAAFCAGADLKAIATLDADAPGGPLGFTRLASPKPTIAAISGHCLAGGLELALWCDLRVATTTATFGCAERRWGVPLIDGGTQRLPRIVGTGRALDLVLTGRPVSAREALDMGLVSRVVPDGTAREEAEALAGRLAAFPQTCLRHDRLSLLEQDGMTEPDALANELRHGLVSLAADTADGAARFRAGEGRHGSFG
jgi:enoyl-CoA hydratase